MRFISANTTEAPCPKKCAACENGTCLKCDKGFALFLSAKRASKFCIPCARAAKAGKSANSDKSQCQGMVSQCNKQLFTFNMFKKQTKQSRRALNLFFLNYVHETFVSSVMKQHKFEDLVIFEIP